MQKDIGSLTLQEATEYLHELRHALLNPGTEFDPWDDEARQLYETKIQLVKDRIESFPTR